jgi:hypothetical protein
MEAPAGLDDGLSATAGALAAAPRDISMSTASRNIHTLASSPWIALARSHFGVWKNLAHGM